MAKSLLCTNNIFQIAKIESSSSYQSLNGKGCPRNSFGFKGSQLDALGHSVGPTVTVNSN